MQAIGQLEACFQLYAVCDPCQRVRRVDLAALIESEGRDYPLDRVRMRLFCRACQTRSEALRIVYVGKEGKASGFRYTR